MKSKFVITLDYCILRCCYVGGRAGGQPGARSRPSPATGAGPSSRQGRSGDTGELQGVVQHLLATPVHRASRGQTLDNYPPTVCSHHMPTDAWFLATIARLLAIIIRLLALMARLCEACEMCDPGAKCDCCDGTEIYTRSGQAQHC